MRTQSSNESPTSVRWQILTILSLIMVVTAFGRLNLGIAGKSIQEEFHLSTQAMGWIFGAFALRGGRGRCDGAGIICRHHAAMGLAFVISGFRHPRGDRGYNVVFIFDQSSRRAPQSKFRRARLSHCGPPG